MESFSSGSAAGTKRLSDRTAKYAAVSSAMWDWFTKARSRRLTITGPLFQEKARALAVAMGHTQLAASNGWLEAWKKRHGVKSSVLSGEGGDVREEDVVDWTSRLPSVCQGYELKGIFNVDETGLFYRTLPKRSLVASGDKCTGGKNSKERITVMLCSSATGEKLPPLIIGKSANPRCFRGVNRAALGAQYYSNKKAWMTSELFEDWLTNLDNRFKAQKRKVLLFIDNCPAHPDVQRDNVKVVFLPPNTTSRLQPMDAGIIQTMKLLYRRMFQRLVAGIDHADSAFAQAKQISVLDAIVWTKAAWDDIAALTIVKCFSHCGFSTAERAGEETVRLAQEDVEPSTEVAGHIPDTRAILGGVTFDEFVTFDKDLSTCETVTDTWEEDIFRAARGEEPPSQPSDDEEEDEASEVPRHQVTGAEAMAHLRGLESYALQHGMEDILRLVADASDIVSRAELTRSLSRKQTSLDFWLTKG